MNEHEFSQLRRGDLVLCEGIPYAVIISPNDDRPFQSSRKDEIGIRSLLNALPWWMRQDDCANLLPVTRLHRYRTACGLEILCADCVRLSIQARRFAGRYLWWIDTPQDQTGLACQSCEESVFQPEDDGEVCSECDGDLGVESTYCGSFCLGCLSEHLQECDICRADWE